MPCFNNGTQRLQSCTISERETERQRETERIRHTETQTETQRETRRGRERKRQRGGEGKREFTFGSSCSLNFVNNLNYMCEKDLLQSNYFSSNFDLKYADDAINTSNVQKKQV